jgi:hypothetical protein
MSTLRRETMNHDEKDLAAAFDLSRHEARDILLKWMESFK